jgi:hypothetical protein
MEFIKFKNNGVLKTAFKETNDLQIFYSSISELNFKCIKNFTKNIITDFGAT